MTNQSEPGETNPICIKCGLWKHAKTPFMESAGSSNVEVLVIGESPGETEDRQGVPFVGRSGELIRQVLSETGFDIDGSVRFTNVVRCCQGLEKITKRAINYCSQFALADIETYDPSVVILLGNSPLNGVLGQTGISQWNGVIVEKDNRTFLPLYHPAYILRNPSAIDEWLDGLSKILADNIKAHFERTIPKTLTEINEMYLYLRGQKYISFDTETSSLDAFSENSSILSVSFACIENNGNKSYSLPIDHPESWWSTKSNRKEMSNRDVVKQIVMDILLEHDGCVIGQNIKFDQMQMYGNLEVEFSAGGDSMLVSHLLDSRQGIHGLKRLAAIHLGMYEYEQELTDYIKAHREANPYYGGSYAKIPLEILLPYGAMDAEAALLVHNKLYDKLSEKQKILYDQMILPVSDALCRMQCNGMTIDYYIAERYMRIYKIKQAELYETILKDKYVKKLVKVRTADAGKKGFRFNPNSSVQLKDLYYHYYRMPVVGKMRPDGKIVPTTSSGAMKTMEDKYLILKMMRLYKLLNKMIGTYLTPAATGKWSSGDGKVRTSYNLHGTRTGRLSSSSEKGLNLQNIPTPEKEPGTLLEILPIKNIFTHSYVRPASTCIISDGKYGKQYDFQTMFGDGALVSADYSGMELRVFASLAKCQPMIDIHKSGKDFHSCVALRALTGKPIDEITFEEIAVLPKAIRYKYKWTNWTLLFGGGVETLHSLYDMPYDEAERLVADYFEAFPEVLELQKQCITFAEDYGYIESPYGRRENLFFINDYDSKKRNADRRAAMNMPVQSGASDTLLIALVVLDNKLYKYRYNAKAKIYRSNTVNTVHDSISLDCPREEVKEVAALCKDVMENVKTYAAEYMPDVDMSWLIAPLKADVDVGSHYGSLMEIEKWEMLVK